MFLADDSDHRTAATGGRDSVTMTLRERRRDRDDAIRFTVGMLSVGASLALGCLALLGVSLLGSGTSEVLLNALIVFVIAYTVVTGYLGYRLALRSWRWWWRWAAAGLVIVPIALVWGLAQVLE
jgi:Kef-type K+ transport system membrane component KefB